MFHKPMFVFLLICYYKSPPMSRKTFRQNLCFFDSGKKKGIPFYLVSPEKSCLFRYDLFVSDQPVVHFLVLFCGIRPGEILCHCAVDHLVPLAFAVIIYTLCVADRI